jgi:hypothetical protein
MKSQYLTAHAFVRYCERVIGIDVKPYRYGSDRSDGAIIRNMRDNGIDVERIRRMILTPYVIAACDMGAVAVMIDGYQFAIRNGRISTIMIGKARRRGGQRLRCNNTVRRPHQRLRQEIEASQ